MRKAAITIPIPRMVTVWESPKRSMVKIPRISPRPDPTNPKFVAAVLALALSPVGKSSARCEPPAGTKAKVPNEDTMTATTIHGIELDQ